MHASRLREEIVHVAHHAAGEPELWQQAAAQVAGWLRANRVALVEHDTLARRGRIRHAAGIDEPFRASYGAKFSGINPWLQMWAGDVGEARRGTDILPNWELVHSDFYKSWLRPQRAFHSLLGIIERRHHNLCCLIALRPPDGEPFASADRRRLAALLPRFGCACDLETRVVAERRKAEVFLDVIEQLPEAVFLVDAAGRARMLNRSARLLLERGDALGFAGGILTAAFVEENRALHRLIESAAGSGAPSPLRGGEMVLSRCAGEAPLVLTVAPVPHALIEKTGEERTVAAIFAGTSAPVATTALSAFYRLTPAEARLANLIVDGHTLLEAASVLHVSRNTARTHMKRIYAKTETHRQAELVRLLAAGLAAAQADPAAPPPTRLPFA